MIAFIEKN